MIELGMENNYPDSWARQTPKGYDPISVVREKCCNCSCNSVTDEMIENQVSFEE